MKTIRNIFTSIALITATSFSTAGHYDNGDSTYAQVVDVQPLYENVRVPQNRRVCEDRRSNNRSQYRGNRNYSSHRSNGGGAVLGGIIGGLIGNRFGKGHGRDAATAAGIIAGAAIGSNAKHRGYNDNRRYNSRNNRNNRNRRHCYTQRDYYEEQRITGYDVSYEYIGRIYHTRMQNHPGDRVKLNVNVQVAEY